MRLTPIMFELRRRVWHSQRLKEHDFLGRLMTDKHDRPLENAPPARLESMFPREVNEARFQKLFEDAEAMSIQGYLVDGTVVYWNRASELIYGYTADEAIGGNLLDLIIPEDMREPVREAVRWMFEHGKGVPPARLALRHKNGSRVSVLSSHTVVAVPGAQPVMFCMDADMRALAQAEEALRIAATAFESQQGMVITDAAGCILRINRAFACNTGYTGQELVGRSVRCLLSPRNPPATLPMIIESVSETGVWQGEIWTRHKPNTDIEEWVNITAVRDTTGLVTHYVGWLTDISQRKEAEAKILQLAFYDPLTHLPNRRLMYDRLKQAMGGAGRSGEFGGVLFVDLDDFKTLNDTLGYEVGDRVLLELANRLSNSVRSSDTVARLGGDEFIVMLEDLGQDASTAAAYVQSVGQKLIRELARPSEFGRGLYQCGACMGAALFDGPEPSADEVIKQAELAMYAAKRSGRGAMRFFDAGMQSEVNRRAELVRGLREGIERQEFRLFVQPQQDAAGHTVGAEALLRWMHPEAGMQAPGQFIQVAEESGVIVPLGNWVLEAACQILVSWADNSALEHLVLSVNVSASQFSQTDFVARVQSVFDRTRARPARLKLELTESMLIHNVDAVIEKMAALRALGVTFSLDDFGTGYSSLSYLQHLPFSELKIDQSFVRNMGNVRNGTTIVETIIGLGHSLGLTVIAEGVEEIATHEQLQAMGCDHFQGYLYGRPIAPEGFVLQMLGAIPSDGA